MSYLSTYLSRNKNKYLIDVCDDFLYTFSKSKNKFDDYFDFKVCLNTNICDIITRDTITNIVLTNDDLHQLRGLD